GPGMLSLSLEQEAGEEAGSTEQEAGRSGPARFSLPAPRFLPRLLASSDLFLFQALGGALQRLDGRLLARRRQLAPRREPHVDAIFLVPLPVGAVPALPQPQQHIAPLGAFEAAHQGAS